ncbi:MAG: VOC family protein [Sneathiella sp.]|uniref:VOC family protein n=1 Tax=Sneathiella sp. TaxID=1964365 RepID=UPI00300397B0
MFSHVMVGADDVEQAKVFYDATLGELGHKPGIIDANGRCFYYTKTGVFSISKPIDGEPACRGNGSTLGFTAANPEMADKWHATGLAKGGETCENPPGVREGSNGNLYIAYLRDPSGNKICALHRMV